MRALLLPAWLHGSGGLDSAQVIHPKTSRFIQMALHGTVATG
ncbi:hypothetical protein EV14_0164 [Prochlorococcus sp. MIT 0703]|nr:hypothetical protein EV14_0164 [Prochlorococcus sp. MIT 0703]